MSQVEERPWGTFEILLDEPYTKVKKITVKPGQRLSYQYHQKRAENWTVVVGQALLTIDGVEMIIDEGNSFLIPEEARHRVMNESDTDDLIIIEVQVGEYFGEDDIVRVDDDYGR
jgi:mannose-6-phosphate isomerase